MAQPRHDKPSRDAAEALARAAPLVSRWIERLLAAHEPPLTLVQYLALRAIAEGELVGADLARRAAVSRAAVSQLLSALEAAGLVERGAASEDRRRQPLELGARGRATLVSAQAMLQDRLAALLVDLPRPEVDALARLLTRLDHTLSGTAPPPHPPRPKHGPRHHPPH
jgi:DNA-binding MarR family transcriptional regulator